MEQILREILQEIRDLKYLYSLTVPMPKPITIDLKVEDIEADIDKAYKNFKDLFNVDL